MVKRTERRCECVDKLCLVHRGKHHCNEQQQHGEILYRVDMDDRTGTYFCTDCAYDAMDSDLYTTRKR